jgi:hypothetical protein
LQTAEKEDSRKYIIREIISAFHSTGYYLDSTEELTNLKLDWKTVIPLLFVLIQLLINPKKSSIISRSTVKNYALSIDTIREIIS